MVIFAGTQGFADVVPVEKMREWEQALIKFLDTSYPEIGKNILDKRQIIPDTDKKLREALTTFKASWQG